MMTRGKIRKTDRAPARVASRARAGFGLGITALAAATTLSVTGPGLSAASPGSAGQIPHQVRTVIIIGNGPWSPGPTPPPGAPTPLPSPTEGETGCCA